MADLHERAREDARQLVHHLRIYPFSDIGDEQFILDAASTIESLLAENERRERNIDMQAQTILEQSNRILKLEKVLEAASAMQLADAVAGHELWGELQEAIAACEDKDSD